MLFCLPTEPCWLDFCCMRLDSTTTNDFCRWRSFQCKQRERELNQSSDWLFLQI
jgi:hypothetical protein